MAHHAAQWDIIEMDGDWVGESFSCKENGWIVIKRCMVHANQDVRVEM